MMIFAKIKRLGPVFTTAHTANTATSNLWYRCRHRPEGHEHSYGIGVCREWCC